MGRTHVATAGPAAIADPAGVKWEWNSSGTTEKGTRQIESINSLCRARGEVRAQIADGTTRFKVAPLASSRNRMTIRPSVVLRPYENVTVTGGEKAPTIALTVDWHKDSSPPRLLSPDNPLPTGAVSFSRATAPRSHRTVNLSVGVNFQLPWLLDSPARRQRGPCSAD
jgi:hypothetical protein